MNWLFAIPIWAWIILLILQFATLCIGYSLGSDQRRQDRKHIDEQARKPDL